jgi:tetratricopeptide (TPR) repeat protein
MTDVRLPRNYFALICCLLVFGTAALYAPLATHPFIIYDDEEYITGNAHVTTGLSWENICWAFNGAHAANWHPLTWVSHQLDVSLFGLNAGGHHLMNVALHIACTLLLFVFLHNVTGALWRSAIVAALFAWHPLHVESVAWASERKDTLSTLFWLLTLLAYTTFAKKRSWLAYVAALGWFALGLMSKPMVVTLPFVLLLLDFWPLGRIQNFRLHQANLKLLAEKIPFFAMAFAGSAVTYLVQSGAGAVWSTPLLDRLANAVVAYARYVAKLFWPTDLAIVYSHPKQWPIWLVLVCLVILAAWTTLGLLRWKRSSFLAVGWFWFLGTLVPTIGIIQVGGQSMADRYTYIPSIGFFIALVWGVTECFIQRSGANKILPILTTGALLALLLLTARQIHFWRDDVTLFRRALEVSPNNYIAANCLGKAYEKIGDNAHALVLYRASVELEPRYPQSQFNLAMTLFTYGDVAQGLKHLQAAAALEARNSETQYTLGIYFGQHASWVDARQCFSNSVSLRPDFAPAQSSYASALANSGDYARAAQHYREALRLDPNLSHAKTNLERLLVEHPELR